MIYTMKYFIIILIGLGLCIPRSVVQASCAAVTPDEQFTTADIVADATVTGFWPWGPVRLSIDRYFKGPENAGSALTLRRSNTSATSVDVDWEKGQRYLVYARRTGSQWSTTVCDGTVVWDQRPSSIDSRTTRTPASTSMYQLTIAGAVIIIIGGSLWFVRRSRRPAPPNPKT